MEANSVFTGSSLPWPTEFPILITSPNTASSCGSIHYWTEVNATERLRYCWFHECPLDYARFLVTNYRLLYSYIERHFIQIWGWVSLNLVQASLRGAIFDIGLIYLDLTMETREIGDILGRKVTNHPEYWYFLQPWLIIYKTFLSMTLVFRFQSLHNNPQ